MTREDELQGQLERARKRIEMLEAALGLTQPVPRSLRLTPMESRLFGSLLTLEQLTLAQALPALYGDRPDAAVPNPQIVNVYISRIRSKLRALGLTIETTWGQGWSISPEDKTLLNEMIRNEQTARDARLAATRSPGG